MSVPCIFSSSARLTPYAREASADHAGGVFLLDWHLVPEDHRNLLFAASHAVLSGNRGSLRRQLAGTETLAPARPFLPLARPDGGAFFSVAVPGTSLLQRIGRIHRATDASMPSIWRRTHPPRRPGSTSWRIRISGLS